MNTMTKEFFEKTFAGYDVPSTIRAASEEICKAFDIHGIADPMYISNVIAKELGMGDGCSHFTDKSPNVENIDYLSKRLMGSYGCNITDVSHVETIIRSNIVQ